jgi:hypothetical protein
LELDFAILDGFGHGVGLGGKRPGFATLAEDLSKGFQLLLLS